jgi:hypothetical protein
MALIDGAPAQHLAARVAEASAVEARLASVLKHQSVRGLPMV